jgi:hypothetical protein
LPSAKKAGNCKARLWCWRCGWPSGDAYAAGAALADDLAAIVASQAQATPEQRAAESAISQIGRLTEWLTEEEPALYQDNNLDTADAILKAVRRRAHDRAMARHDLQAAIMESNSLRQQITQMDAANADLLNKVHQAQVEIDRMTRQNVIATDTFNSLAADRTNGAAAVSQRASAGRCVGRSRSRNQRLPHQPGRRAAQVPGGAKAAAPAAGAGHRPAHRRRRAAKAVRI